MNKIIPIITAMLLALPPGAAIADPMAELGTRAARAAMDQLGFERGDGGVLAITNAGYAILDGQTTQAAIRGLTAESGNSIGDGNLLQVLRPCYRSLWFYFYNKGTGEALYLQVDGRALNSSLGGIEAMPDDRVFSRVSRARVDLEYLLNHTDEGNATFKGAFGGNEFSLVGISNIWARGGPFDFLIAASFHDHICPGVTSGYMLARFLEDALPIKNASSESYKVIAVPQWCKDDLLQLRWDATPGKSGMFVMALTDAEKSALRARYNQTDVAGIYIRWNDTSKQGDAMVLGFNWTKMYDLTGTSDWKGPSWASKLVMDVAMMDYLDSPDIAVSVLEEFKVDQRALGLLQSAGVHPLKVAGVL